MNNESLYCDSDGDLFLLTESDESVRSRLLGHIDRPGTAGRVPSELAGRLAELEAEWASMVEFRAACRATADWSYLNTKGAK